MTGFYGKLLIRNREVCPQILLLRTSIDTHASHETENNRNRALTLTHSHTHTLTHSHTHKHPATATHKNTRNHQSRQRKRPSTVCTEQDTNRD